MQENEIRRIRRLFRASRKQFAEVFLGKSESSVKWYETGKVQPPEGVLMLAHCWEGFLETVKGGKKCKK